jgi:hypothetical protein
MSLLSYPSNQNALLGLLKPIKRKVFISYHHKTDQTYYNLFSQYFSDTLDLFYDNSLDRALDSTNSEYLNRKIREENIFGTSLTIVLCGSETGKRRWIDWEIHATLHYQHGLLGIILPTCSKDNLNKFLVPDRFHENVESGYALWMHWTQDASILKTNMEAAIQRSNSKLLIKNSAAKMKRSLS